MITQLGHPKAHRDRRRVKRLGVVVWVFGTIILLEAAAAIAAAAYGWHVALIHGG